jgi:hypothetical protein
MMYPSLRRKRALAAMITSICLVIFGMAFMAIPHGAGRAVDGLSAGVTTTGLIGGVTSWIASRRD